MGFARRGAWGDLTARASFLNICCCSSRQRVGPTSSGIAPRACAILNKLLLLLLLPCLAKTCSTARAFTHKNTVDQTLATQQRAVF